MAAKVRSESDGAVRIITIDRPERRNAIDPETAEGLQAAFRAFEDDAEASVAVLRGEGDTFCAGFDLKSLSDGGLPRYEPEGEGPLGISRWLLSKPTIAAVEGHAVAGGIELALWCDLRVAAEGATFGVYCRRFGVPLVDGGTVRLPRLIGQSRALDMILTGRGVGAEEAFSWGLANRLVPRGRALEEAVALAHDLTRFPQICMRADRRSAIEQWGLPLADALRAEGRGGVEPLRQEAREGASRFAGGAGRGGSYESF